ncbi:matrixin, partial [Halobium palmae]
TAEPTDPASTVAFDSENPWGREVVTVGVNDSAGVERNLTALVEEAIEYWNTEGRGYGEYAVKYEVDPDARSPDVEVQFVREIESCGHERGGELLGCAPQLHANSAPPTPVPVRVETGYSDESTVETIKHELGHTRGLNHGDEPAFMNASGVAYTLPQRDAVDRAYPWATSNFTVYVDASNVSAGDRPAFRRQVTHALDYYEGAPPTVPANVSYTLVDDPSEATVVVRYVDDGGDPGSRAVMQGIDVDGDGALERRTKATIRLSGLDVDETGYHTGYWLGRLLGADDTEELPPPFRGGTDPTSEWWT